MSVKNATFINSRAIMGKHYETVTRFQDFNWLNRYLSNNNADQNNSFRGHKRRVIKVGLSNRFSDNA